ncbi:MAG: AI-2E family transporter [Haloferacaceae archaeon]
MRRRYVLGGLFTFLAVVAAAALVEVLATVFFAVTVAYLLGPVRTWLVDRGLTVWWASLVATALAFVAAAAVVTPLVAVLVVRLDVLVGLIQSVPGAMSFELFGFAYDVTLAEVRAFLTRVARSTARALVRAVPVLALKFSVFVLLVFSLVSHQREARRAVLAVVPPAYRDVAEALNARVRSTLFAIYVLQAATAVGTFLVAVPVFVLFGYDFPVALAVAAGVLQFLPIIGPSVLLAALAAYHASVGEVTTAVLLLVVGGTLVAWLPDLLVRPRLARTTTNMPGSLYFIGFVGGLLSLGTVGVIAGPLAVALLVEAANLLSAELNDVAVAEPDAE